jgi:hypothetical protein
MAEYNFPTETIDLPSGGKFYPEGSPLRSGKVDVKYMTAKEEDILTSTNLILKGLVIDKLMESVIVTPGVKPEDFLIGDLNAVTVAARVLAYGKEYPIQASCNACKLQFEHIVDLAQLETIEPQVELINGEYELTLPTGTNITFKLLTRADEKEIVKEVNALKKLNPDIEPDSTTRLKYILTSVNGNRDRKVVREYADSMLIRDARALRDYYKKVSPDINFDIDITCTGCGNRIAARMPFGANFLWPDLTVQT